MFILLLFDTMRCFWSLFWFANRQALVVHYLVHDETATQAHPSIKQKDVRFPEHFDLQVKNNNVNGARE